MIECKICGRECVENNLCEYHDTALGNLQKGFERWREAIDGLTWEEYIDRIQNLDGTGRWIREVIESIRSQDDL
jgi:hypothetical protein